MGSPPASPVDAARRQLGAAMRHFIVGDRPPARDLSQPLRDDPGLYGPGSVTWKVHADASMLVGGLRSLVLQTMHPLAMAGVAEHSAYRTDPVGRLWRTSAYVGLTTYGTTAQAEAAVRAVKRVHEGVTGIAPDGRPYAANDPHLLGWVHHTLVESFLGAYQRYGGTRLSPTDADRYVDEQARIALLIGATDPLPARSVAELEAWMLAIRPELRASRRAREAVRFLLLPPLPLAARPAYAVLAPAAVGLLPGWVRRALWLPRLPVTEALAVRPAARTLVRVLDWAMRAPAA